jgi:hypothetical protein
VKYKGRELEVVPAVGLHSRNMAQSAVFGPDGVSSGTRRGLLRSNDLKQHCRYSAENLKRG